MYGEFGMGGFGGGFMWIVWIALIVAIIWAASGFANTGTDSGRQHTPSARELLDERYARGEIDEDEYRRRRANLE